MNLLNDFVRACGLATTLAAAALAGSPGVGQVPPELNVTTWVGDAPRQTSLAALKGEVVVVELWGVKCPPCRALIPHMQKLWDEHGGKGLHIFALEAQNHSVDEIKACLAQNGHKSYPVAAGGGNGYDTGGGIPHAWVIGVDGKVAFEGNPGDGQFDQTIKAELAKIRFPGLGRSDFDKGVSKALGLYAKKDLGGARREAQKLAANEKGAEATRADATWLVERFTKLAQEQLALADEYAAGKRYAEASEVLSWLAETMKKEEEGTAAKDKLDALKADPAVKKELEAAKKLSKLLAALEGRPAAEKKATLEKFARDDKVAGTRAAEQASQTAASLK